MLTDDEIQRALHASRVVPLSVPNPHGPLGLEQLTAAVARLANSPVRPDDGVGIRCPVLLSVQTWEKLERIARSREKEGKRPISVSEVATTIIEEFVASVS